VTFSKKKRPPSSSSIAARGSARFVLPPLLSSPVARYVVYAALALVFAAYGLVRHYTNAMPPMHRAVAPPPAPTFDEEAGEVPVPELTPWDGG
jgi:hypothetical protein